MPRVGQVFERSQPTPAAPAVQAGNGSPSLQGEAGGLRLAVNVVDLLRVNDFIRSVLLKDAEGNSRLDAGQGAIRVDPQKADETAVAFACPLLVAASICDTIRGHDKAAGDSPTRVYLLRQTWQKLAGGVKLTLVLGGQCVLNPAVFGAKEAPAVGLDDAGDDEPLGLGMGVDEDEED